MGLLQECHNNTVFKPFQILDEGFQITIVNDTGICVDPLMDPVPGCENYQSNNPWTPSIDVDAEDEDKSEFHFDLDYMDGLDKDVADYLWNEHWNQDWNRDSFELVSAPDHLTHKTEGVRKRGERWYFNQSFRNLCK